MSLSLFSSKTKNNDVFVDDNVRVSILLPVAHVPGRVRLDFTGNDNNDGGGDGMTHDVTTLFRLQKSDAE